LDDFSFHCEDISLTPPSPSGRGLDKGAIRADMLARRQELSADYMDYAALRLIDNFPKFITPDALAGYYPTRNEINPLPLMDALPAQGFLPRMLENGQLEFLPWQAGDELLAGKYGILQPRLIGDADFWSYEKPVILLPLLAFDAQGNRLGYGAGFYDKTLAKLPNYVQSKLLRIGLAYDFQQVEIVPTAPHDVALDGVVTESRFLNFSSC